MTNISNLPQLAATVTVVRNADWRDTIQFQYPNGSVNSSGASNAGQPIDLTGITFEAELRGTISDQGSMLKMSTANGLLVVDTAIGTLSFAVPRDGRAGSCMSSLQYQSAVMDLLAFGDGQIINLFQVAGPATVTINAGITRDP